MTDRPAGRRPLPEDQPARGAVDRPMMLELVLLQMQARDRDPACGRETGQLGFMQWLGGLPGGCDYAAAARAALARLGPDAPSSPALATFRALLVASLAVPPRPLGLSLPVPRRRGGTRARRLPH
ncbi:hypothetical protein [Rhodovulum strictum]|uniref:Uncharacterized protein n=1 Tax=Rhodovulum strictum TaxID=58314 RepID=A0A844B5X6_9RHOB|nr:hypothetical protein [Rhodovulum strictum]MRH21776.1 hypothetical protein [Rhodovulum strictum]